MNTLFWILGIAAWWGVGFSAYMWSFDWDRDEIKAACVFGLLGPIMIWGMLEVEHEMKKKYGKDYRKRYGR